MSAQNPKLLFCLFLNEKSDFFNEYKKEIGFRWSLMRRFFHITHCRMN